MPLEPAPSERFPAAGLAGRLVRLRRFSESDITPRYLGWLHDAEVLRFSNQRFRRHDTKTSLAYLASFAGTPNLFLAICDGASGETIGTMTAYASIPHETADIGILVGERSLWGKGIGREAWCLLVDWMLTEARVRKLTAGCGAGNHGMLRLMNAAGMRHEATRRAQEIIDGQPHDLLYFARFRDG
jgi:RimJ/RimL family protein N-acetyltransferase